MFRILVKLMHRVQLCFASELLPYGLYIEKSSQAVDTDAVWICPMYEELCVQDNDHSVDVFDLLDKV